MIPQKKECRRKRVKHSALPIHKMSTVDAKVDGGCGHIRINPLMFKSVVELVRWSDTENPAPGHPTHLALWKGCVEREIEDIVDEDTAEVQESVGAAKEIGLALLGKFLAAARAVGWSEQPPELRIMEAEQVLARPQIPQRTAAWYAQGKTVLTASEFGTLFGTPRAVGQLVMNKVPVVTPVTAPTNRLACLTCEMGPFDWGVRFEPVVKQILSKRWGLVIAEAGRIVHAEDPHLAASPDGIIMDATDPARIGRLLEIKCPIRRAIGEGVPFDYWCQMQIQMEVTGIEECEYVEVKIESLEGVVTDISGEPEGFVWLVQNDETCEMRYVYTVKELAALGAEWHQLEAIPWRVGGFYSEVCVRDRAWFNSTAEMRAAFWSDVERARAGGFEVPVGRSKPKGLAVTVTKECQIVD